MRFLIIATAVLLALLGFGAYLTHSYEPARVLYKRWKAGSPYQFEEIDPKFAAVNPAEFFKAVRNGTTDEARQSILELLKQQQQAGPAARLVIADDADLTAREKKLWSPIRDEMLTWHGLGGLKRLKFDLGEEVYSYVYMLSPKNPNGSAVVYHHGYGELFVHFRPLYEALLDAGYVVLIYNHFGNAENYVLTQIPGCEAMKDKTPCLRNLINDLDDIGRGVHYQLTPLFMGMEYLKQELEPKSIDVIGFSAGAPMATLMGALDQRFRKVIAVAGIYPDYLREKQEDAKGLEKFGPIRDAVSIMDLFVMASLGVEREYVQIFNRYDRCCYRNTKSRLYEGAVREAVRLNGEGGHFKILIDESHADHKISDWGIAAVMRILEK